jgi:hypothetical protein
MVMNAEKKSYCIYKILKIACLYNLYLETLFSSIQLCELYIDKVECKISNLMCLRCVVTNISYKLIQDENDYTIDDWLYASNYVFGRNEFVKMEMEILKYFDYNLYIFSVDSIPDDIQQQNIIFYFLNKTKKRYLNPKILYYLRHQMDLLSVYKHDRSLVKSKINLS